MIRLPLALLMLIAALWLIPHAERDPVIHVLVQIPLLVGIGVAGAWGFQNSRDRYSLLIVALFTLAFWMLPRSIDAALGSLWVDGAKFITLPLLAGVPFTLCWSSLTPMLRGFLKANALSMLGVLGFLYIHAPVRICNSYLVSDQERLGYGFLYLAAGLIILWGWPLLFGALPAERLIKRGFS
ncbi:hypothetical protein [Coralliovum pocilloporae]|uniref:hypothetical protein n=1 Tax=Coralliovum pocilloporae TaxID=3066369 RepID=UPI003307B6AC